MKRSINLINKILFSNFKRLNDPYKVTLALTYRCNLKCKICNIWRVSEKKELALDEIDKIFKNLENTSWINLTGGEIVLREDFIEAVKIMIKNTKKLLLFKISTNGQFPEKVLLLIKEILRFGVIPIVTISIDGPSRMNDELRGGRDSYLKIIETFKLLKGLPKGHYYLCCTISKYNIDYLDELLTELRKDMPFFCTSDMHFNLFHHSSHYYNNQNIDGLSNIGFENIKKYFKLNKFGNFYKQILDNRYAKGLSKYLNGNKFPVKCQALKSTCFINPCGDVYPCGFYDRPIGNLRDWDYNLVNLWNSQYAFRVLKEIESKKCPSCWSHCEAYPALLGNLKKTLVM